jgi:cytochrome b pre-mRNA-processing protein 3
VIGLPKTFNTWAVVCFLHMWILKVRIRELPRKMAGHWNELLTNHFFWEAEKTMDFQHKMDATERKKYLGQYFQVWTGSILAYDEGLVKGDAVLAAAVWRMLFSADENADPVKIALVVAYIRREIARIAALDDQTVARGYVGFGKPISEAEILKQSPSMRQPFRAGELEEAAT